LKAKKATEDEAVLTLKCHLPEERRESDDVCHILCLQIDAIHTQNQMYVLQKTIFLRLVSLETAIRELTEALRYASANAGGGPGPRWRWRWRRDPQSS
jgi:hypothetical protein